MKRVLFVDDEAHLLSGLRRVLHPKREEWEMTFLQDSRRALELATREPFDVVVTDMHMPGLDGAQLLAELEERTPQTIRILLSGRSGDERLPRSLVHAHQFVDKPCNPMDLEQAFERAFTLRDMLCDERLVRITSGVTALPSLPSIYTEVQRVLRAEGSLEEVAELIGRDIGLTAKLLQLVNSAMFGLRRHISNIREAVTYLGLSTISATILADQLFRSDPSCFTPSEMDAIWGHSTAVGRLAREIARLEGCDEEAMDQAFLAGLLHEGGVLVLACSLGAELRAAWRAAASGGIAVHAAEKRLLGASHGMVGAYLFTLWGLPEPVVEAIAFSHEPSACAYSGFSLVTALHMADALVADSGRPLPGGVRGELDQGHLDRLGLGERVAVWRGAARRILESGD